MGQEEVKDQLRRYKLHKKGGKYFMGIEHIGLSVSAPIDMSNWYCAIFGFRVVRQEGTNDDGVSFIIDDNEETILELYKLPEVPALPVNTFIPIQFHIAIDCEKPFETANILVDKGATFVGEAPRNEYKGEKYLIRDPWGFVIQLVNRKTKLKEKKPGLTRR